MVESEAEESDAMEGHACALHADQRLSIDISSEQCRHSQCVLHYQVMGHGHRRWQREQHAAVTRASHSQELMPYSICSLLFGYSLG